MAGLKGVIGELRWTPPPWFIAAGPGRVFGAAIGVVMLAIVGYLVTSYLDSRPQPPGIVGTANPPALASLIDGELVPEPITVDFSVVTDGLTPDATPTTIARLDLVGQVVARGIELQPAVAGEWRWRDEDTLVFTPVTPWPAGQRYTVSWEAGPFDPGLELREHQTEFVTPEFVAALSYYSFYQDPVDSGIRKVVASFDFSHPVDTADLTERLVLAMRPSGATVETRADTIGFELRMDEAGRVAHVHSDVLSIPREENFLTLTVSSGLAPAAGPSRYNAEIVDTVRIPDIGSYFRIDQANALIARDENDNPRQAVTLTFTDRVASEALNERINLYLLPNSVTVNGTTVNNKRWNSPAEVTGAVQAQAESIPIAVNPVEGDIAAIHSVSLDVPAERYLYLVVDAGLRSSGEFVLADNYATVLRVPDYPREARVALSGSLLPLSGDRRLSLVSRGVETLRVEIARVIDDEINHLATQSQGDIRSPYFRGYPSTFSEDEIVERQVEFIDVASTDPREASYSHLDLSAYAPEGGTYLVSVQGWDRQRGYGIGSSDKRLVMTTDLGLLVKTSADGSHDVFVQSMTTGQPVANAVVELLGKNGIPVLVERTDASGHSRFASTRNLRDERQPTVFVVRRGRDSAFLPVARPGRQLQLSRFDIGGDVVRADTAADRLRALIFSDRGLYRPGESVRLAALIKRDDWRAVEGIPVILHVRDSRGQTVLDKRLTLPSGGLFDETLLTEAASPTGQYRAIVYLIDDNERRRAIGSANFRVAEFQPDRLRIRSRFTGAKPTGWLAPGTLSATVSLENLFGTPAAERRVTGEYTVTPIQPTFPAFSDYRFAATIGVTESALQAQTTTLDDVVTDDTGNALFTVDLSRYVRGFFRVDLTTDGYDVGDGRSVRAEASIVVSPASVVIGYRSDSDLTWLDRDSQHFIELIALNSDASPVALDDLTLSIAEERFVSMLVQRPNGTFAYQSVLREQAPTDSEFSIAADGANIALPTDAPGRYIVRIKTADGTTLSAVRYTVAGAGNVAGELERDAELELTLDQSSYSPGDTIRLQVQAPYTGSGLITIERDRVYSHQWFQADTSTTVQSIRVPDSLEGNAYVNVAFVRSPDSPEIFVSPLSYAAAPFGIDRDARTIELALDAPTLAEPGDTVAVDIRADRPSKAIVYAVDEGILSVARYRLPDPLGFFLRKMALQVRTHQMVDLLLPSFDTFLRVAAPGGGEARALAGKNLNPFRRKSEPPVVYWSGVLDVGDEPSRVEFNVPDYYNGELRIMAVATADSAVGRQSTRATVRGPFVITPNLLTHAAPGDEFDVTVGIANNLDGSGADATIDLAVTPSAAIELLGPAQSSLQVGEGQEGRATIRVRATDAIGAARLNFVVSSGAVAVRRTATLSVRPAVPFETTVTAAAGPLRGQALALPRQLAAPLAEQSAAASTSPLVLTDGLLAYVQRYPHLCAEQMVSRVFPQLGLIGNGDADLDESEIRAAFDDVVGRLRARQTADGWFRFWRSSTAPVGWPTIYIGHFLTDARERGMAVPRDMLDGALRYGRRLAGENVDELAAARLRAYTIYVLTRNGEVTTNALTDLHETLERWADTRWESDLTAAYMAASYAMLKQANLAERLIRNYRTAAEERSDTDFDTELGRNAQYVYLVSRHFPALLAELSPDALTALVDGVAANHFNTISSAYAVLALGAYTEALASSGELPSLSLLDPTGALVAGPAAFARASIDVGVESLTVGGADDRPVYRVLTQSGFDRSLPDGRVTEGIEVYREFLDSNGRAVGAATIGDELTVRVRVRSSGDRRTNVAIVDLLPGGFEIIADSLSHTAGDGYIDFQDVREDRLVSYGHFGDRMTELRYRVKVTSAGTFVVPAVAASSMYDRRIRGRTRPGEFEVRAAR
ncbi:MAG: alpha-2-macroglobulin [Pseudomonadota bacterium]